MMQLNAALFWLLPWEGWWIGWLMEGASGARGLVGALVEGRQGAGRALRAAPSAAAWVLPEQLCVMPPSPLHRSSAPTPPASHPPAAFAIKQRIYGNRIVLFAPLYIANYCVNNCRYCAFRQGNKDLAVGGLWLGREGGAGS